MGGNFRDEKKPVQREGDRTTTTLRDRTSGRLDGLARDVDSENRQQRNGLGRSKLESWHKSESETVLTDRKDRDRTKSWRDRDPDAARNDDRRWGGADRDRDQRAEREPEWFDEPVQEKKEAHTQQDFQKWMEQMKKAKIAASGGPDISTEAAEARIQAEKPAVKSAPAVEAGPDKFFMAFGGSSSLEQKNEPEQKEAAPKPKAGGKSSRFTSFFSQPQEEPARQQPPTPAATAPPPSSGPPDLAALLAARPPAGHPSDDKQAFQQLLAKLQKQTMSATPPGLSLFSPPQQQPQSDRSGNGAVVSPGPYQQRDGRRDASGPQEILAPRPQQQSARPDQLLRDFASGQHQRTASQGSSTAPRENTSARNNSNTEFLMNLMRGPHSQSNTPKQHQQPQQPPPHPDDADGRTSQQQRRPQPPPGFHYDPSGDGESRSGQQPTQILQRPPPGLDQMPPGWMPPPPGQRGAGGPMMPPPGLRGGPMPPMFPPNFPPGAIPPPPGNMPMPPPGFFNGPPPHGFGPPPGMPFNGPPGAFGSPPFEERGMPPPPGRGYNRQ